MRCCKAMLLLLCLWPFASQAGLPGPLALQYRYLAWSVAEGLPQSVALSVVQDSHGFIWVGTQDGLARFDGASFEIFTAHGAPGLVDNYISALLATPDGRLWVGTAKGISVYEHGRMRAVTHDAALTGSVNGLASQGDTIWAATGHGLFRVTADSQISKVAGLPNMAITGITVTPDGTLWVGGKGGAWSHPAGASRFYFHTLPDVSLTVQALAVWHDHVWAATQAGLYRFDGGKTTLFPAAPIKREFVRTLLPGPHGGLWVGTDHGLFRIDPHERLQDFRLVPQLGPAWIRALAFDREGNLWVGTSDNGLVRLRNNGVASFGSNVGLKDELTTWAVYREPKGRVWIGTAAGVYELQDGYLRPRFDTAALPAPLVSSFLRVGPNLLIGTLKGLTMARDGRLVPLPAALAKVPHSLIYNLSPARGGGIWIGTSVGLYRWRNGQVQHFGPADGLPESRTRVVSEIKDGSVWIGTEHGLFIGRNGRFHAAGHTAGLNNESVQYIFQTIDGSVWIALRGSAIIRYKNGRFTRYDESAGLAHGMFFGIAADGAGRLWITGKAIYSVRIADFDRYDAGRIARIPEHVYNVPDDRHTIGCNGGGRDSIAMDSAGNLWCPATGSVIAFNTRQPPYNAAPPPAAIEQVKAGQAHPAGRLDGALIVPPGQTDVQFSYTGLSFQNVKQVLFKYMLAGYDTDWINAGDRREAFYTNLPPGRYVFKVKARNNDGVWSAAPAELTVVLQPFFYQTMWFRLLAALLVVLALWGLYYWRMRQVRAKRLALEAMVAQRTAELTEANERLAAASVTDALTGLKNRRHLREQICADLAHVRRAHTAPDVFPNKDIAFLMIDVDDFKAVNDSYGHRAGDRLLIEIGNILMREMRESDYVIRWGGEEFLVVARNTENAQTPSLAERLRRALDRQFDMGGGVEIRCTCSIGYCGYPLTPRNLEHPDWEGVVALADIALYKAKAAGKNAWAGVCGTAITGVAWNSIDARRDFDRLVADGELELVMSETAEAEA